MDVKATGDGVTHNMAGVKHIILVMSGKGGVGKSTVATQLAFGFKMFGKKVGILDVDLCGPSIPKMLDMEDKEVHSCTEGWVPVYLDPLQQVGVMSIGFLLNNKDAPVVWRGPKKNAMIKQFVSDVYWQGVDFLIIDTPPGTSDEHITIVEALREYSPDGAVLVTTPQAVAVGDVRRELTFCKKTGVPVLGVVENMSGFVCPHCSECTNVFSTGGGKALATQFDIPFLGAIPLDPNLSLSEEKGKSFLETFEDSPTREAVLQVVQHVIKATMDKYELE